jgi:hypothetical protein
VVGKLSKFITEIPSRYSDPGNPVVTIEINGVALPNTLIYIWATINVMSINTMKTLQLDHLRPTQTITSYCTKEKQETDDFYGLSRIKQGHL